jgi:DNA-binding XRE family transcriptional regulator
MMIGASITAGGIYVRFADEAAGIIPWGDLKLEGNAMRVDLPDSDVLRIELEDGGVEEIPWDYARHYADEGYQEQAEKAAGLDRQILGERLRRLRAADDLSQEALAERSGVGRATIARIESGAHSPRYQTLEAIAKGLKLPLEKLLFD